MVGWRGIDRALVVVNRLAAIAQRAITLGLAFINARLPGHSVVVMDGDGEDTPADIPSLVEQADLVTDRPSVIFAFTIKAWRPSVKVKVSTCETCRT